LGQDATPHNSHDYDRGGGNEQTQIETGFASSVLTNCHLVPVREQAEAAGNQPASHRDVTGCKTMTYNTRSGGGGNCTRVPVAASCDFSRYWHRWSYPLSASSLHRFGSEAAHGQVAGCDAESQGGNHGIGGKPVSRRTGVGGTKNRTRVMRPSCAVLCGARDFGNAALQLILPPRLRGS